MVQLIVFELLGFCLNQISVNYGMEQQQFIPPVTIALDIPNIITLP